MIQRFLSGHEWLVSLFRFFADNHAGIAIAAISPRFK